MSLESSRCPGCWRGHPVPWSSAGPSQRCCGDATAACSLPCCEQEGGATLLRKPHLRQPPPAPGSQRGPSQAWHGARTLLTWGTQHRGARLWSRGPAGPACPHCPPSWRPLRGPAVGTAPLQPAPEGHTQSLRTRRSPCPAPTPTGAPVQDRPGGPAGEPGLQGLEGAGLHLLQTLTLLPPLLISSPVCLSPQSHSQATPVSKVGPEEAPARLHTPSPGLTTAGTSTPGSSCGRSTPGFRLSASPWGTGSGVRAGQSAPSRAAASDPRLASHNTCSRRGARCPPGTGPRGCPPSLPVCLHWEREEERREGAAPGRCCQELWSQRELQALRGCWAGWGGKGARGGGGGGGGVTHRAARLLILPFLAVQTADLSLGTRMRDSLKETPAEKQTDERTDRQTDGREKGRNKRGTKSP